MTVSYYPVAMYRHQQAVASAQGSAHQFHHSGSMHHTWYPPTGYHLQQMPPQVTTPQTPSYCMQDEQASMWHHHSVFHQDYPDLSHHHAGGIPLHQQHHQQMLEPAEPSPPITISGSELSSPGAVGGTVSPSNPQSRPPTVRSPYEWIKKTTYNNQPNPDAAGLNSESLLDFSVHQESPGMH